MDTYLLLRSNKKSGPYDLNQLLNLGLKPYDLVWVEGKSAAWRYPSEVDSLKEYAPSVEEQPFDRFYKKPNEEKVIAKPSTKQEQVLEEPVIAKPIIANKKVFVSMPGNQFIQRTVQSATAKNPVIIQEKVEERKPEPVRTPIVIEEKIVERKPLQVNEEPVLNDKYSESLDDIKKRYTEVYLNRKSRSKWGADYKSILQVVGGAVFFCLLVIIAYKNFEGDNKPEKSSRTTVIQPKRNAASNTNTLTNNSVPVQPIINEPKNQTAAKLEVKTFTEKKNTTQQKNEVLAKEDKMTAVNEVKPERKAVMPPQAETRSEDIKAKPKPVNIASLVNVKANNYKQRAFGGVLNLELTVNNESKFALDKVIVELQYLKPSEQPLKTDKIVFNAVAPGGSQTLKIPDYLRGIKVVYKIIEIESAQYQSYIAGL